MGSIIDRALDIINDHLKDQTSSFSDPVSLKPMARGGHVLEDDYPSHYLPGVGRQVMAGGGAPIKGFEGRVSSPVPVDEPVAAEGVEAYHGSPHEFEEFDPSFIGTGEGAQAYGHGLYFAENEGVARDYRDRLTDRASTFRVDNIDMPKWVLRKIENHPDRKQAIDEVRNDFQKRLSEFEEEAKGSSQPWLASGKISMAKDVLSGLDKIESGSKLPNTRGRMYEVRIDAHPEKHLLDWDKPLSEQHPNIQKAIHSLGLLKANTPENEVRSIVRGLIDKHGIDEQEAIRRAYDDVNSRMTKALHEDNDDEYDKLTDMDFAIRQWWDSGTIGEEQTGMDPTGGSILQELERSLSNNKNIVGERNSPEASKKLSEVGIRGIRYLDAGSRGIDGKSGSRNIVVFDPKHIKVKRRYAEGGGIKAYFMHAPQDFIERAKRAYGGAIYTPELQGDPDDIARRLILWSYAAAPLGRPLARAEGGATNDPVDKAANIVGASAFKFGGDVYENPIIDRAFNVLSKFSR